MTDKLDLPRRYRDQLEVLLREHMPDAEVWAYGSRVTGKSHDGSDLDLVLRSPTLEPLAEGFFDLLEAIEKSNIPILVQAHDWARLPESFHREIERDYIVVHQGPKQATGGWQEASLGEVIELKRGYDLPQRKRIPGSVPLVSSSGVTYYHTEAKVKGPGVVTGRYGTLGEVFFVPSDFWPLNTTLYVRDFKGNDPRFISYFLRGLDFSAYSDKAAVPGLNRNHLHQAAVRYPADITEQRAIAHILGTLDDKIELNRRMNQTLGEMARAIFQDWFVDFGPVHAKLEGREPYLPPELWDLFPDRLVDSELGEVPEGWGVGVLGDVVSQIRNNDNPQLSPKTLFSHFSIPAFDQGEIPIREFGRDIKSTKSRVQPGAVLLSKLNPEIERVWLVDMEPEEPGICSTEFLVLWPTPPFQRSYVYCLARSTSFREQVQTLVTGTSKSHQRAQAGPVLSLPAIIPPVTVVQAFGQQVSVLLERSLSYRREVTTLAAKRDALLPSLISGGVRAGEPLPARYGEV